MNYTPHDAEFYPRRLYTRIAKPSLPQPPGGFCIVNNTAAPAYTNWDETTGRDGLAAELREWHQPRGDGNDEEMLELADYIIELATKHGHLPGKSDT